MQTIQQAVQKIEVGWKSQRIRLAGQTLGDGDFRILRDILSEHPSIKSLELCVCNVSEANLIELIQNLRNFSLLGLQLAHVALNLQCAIYLATAIQESGLKKLDITYNNIGPNGCEYIANALMDSGIECLLMARNNIGRGIIRLAHVLANHSTTIKTLDVSKNDIKDEGGLALIKVIERSSLECLLVDVNELGPETIIAICSAVVKSKTLVEISLSGNNVKTKEAMEAIANMLTKCPLEYLALNSCNLDNEDMEILARGIKSSVTIESLELKDNANINDSAIENFMGKIGPHRALRKIELEDCGLTRNGERIVADRLTDLHSKRTITLVTLVSPKIVPRLGYNSPIMALPVDNFRLLREYLPAF